MTEIEEKFYKVFGIEPKELDYPDNFEYYPEITSDILLKLICILNDYYSRTMQCCTMLTSKNILELKGEVLKEFIDVLQQYTNLSFLEKDRDEREEEDWIKHQVQQLFESEV